MNRRTVSIAASIAAALPLAAHATDGKYPGVGMDYGVVAQYDFSRLARDPDTITSDGYFDIQSVAHFRITPDNEIWLGTEASPVIDVSPGQRRWLNGTGLAVTDLNFYHQGHDNAYRIGKLDVPFGRAQDAAPGLYTGDFVGPYALGGMIGGSYEHRWYTDGMGIIAPSLSTYFVDTSILSRAYFQPDGQTRRSDGGAANTGRFNSGAFVVNWLAPGAIPNLEVQAGYMFNHKGETTDADPPTPPATAANETLRTVSLRYMLPLASSTDLGATLRGHYLDVVPFVEYVDVSNENGIAGNDTSYLTTSLTVDYGRFAYGITHTDKSLDAAFGNGSSEYISELSVVYHLTGLIDVTVSGGRTRQGGETSNLIGLALSYSGAF
jgi:hypothetical protein